MNRLKNNIFLDKLAVALSATCMVHCLVLPLGLSVFPILQGGMLDEQLFHALLLILVIPSSVVALSIGCRRHQHFLTGVIGFVGLFVLSLTAFWGHDLLGPLGERIATSIGGGILATSHIMNYRYCRSSECNHD